MTAATKRQLQEKTRTQNANNNKKSGTKSQGRKVRDEKSGTKRQRKKERKLAEEKKKTVYGSYNNLISFKGLVSPPPLYNEIPTCLMSRHCQTQSFFYTFPK